MQVYARHNNTATGAVVRWNPLEPAGNPLAKADFDCPKLLPKASVTVSEAVAADDV